MKNEASDVRLYEEVIKKIEHQFETGTLKVGDRLSPERELVKELNVSRGTIRDAFRILESQGIIETRRGGGRYLKKEFKNRSMDEESVISKLQKAAILDLLETREIIEVGMVSLVCDRATEEDFQRLEDIVYKSKDESTTIKGENIDYYFHHALAECSKNTALVNFIELNLELINQTRQKNFTETKNFHNAQEEHYEVVKAIRTRNVELATQKVLDHFRQIRKRLN